MSIKQSSQPLTSQNLFNSILNSKKQLSLRTSKVKYSTRLNWISSYQYSKYEQECCIIMIAALVTCIQTLIEQHCKVLNGIENVYFVWNFAMDSVWLF